MKKKDTPEAEHVKLIEAFEFLDELRDSGVTNMWGATPFIVSRFHYTYKKATEIHLMWIRSFDPEKTMDERLEVAFK